MNTIMDLFLDHAFPYDSVLLDWQCHEHQSAGAADNAMAEICSGTPVRRCKAKL